MFYEKLDLFGRITEGVEMIDLSLVKGDMQQSVFILKEDAKEIREEIARWTTSTPMVGQKRLETIIIMIN